MNPKRAYTLIEVLIVLVIIGLLSGGGIGVFYSLYKTQVIDQSMLNIKSYLEHAKHGALFNKRGAKEPWIYSVGVDFTNLSSVRELSLVKICSTEDGYATNPNFARIASSGIVQSNEAGECNWEGSIDSMVIFEGVSGVTFDSLAGDLSVVSADGSLPIGYITFESVRGTAHFYRADNYAEYKGDYVIIKINGGSKQIKVTRGAAIQIL